MKKKFAEYLLITIFILLIEAKAEAQFYKIYSYKTRKAGEIEFVYWTSYIASSDLYYRFFNIR